MFGSVYTVSVRIQSDDEIEQPQMLIPGTTPSTSISLNNQSCMTHVKPAAWRVCRYVTEDGSLVLAPEAGSDHLYTKGTRVVVMAEDYEGQWGPRPSSKSA